MKANELTAMVGETITIRSTRHVCVGAGIDALLLLQFENNGEPLQYIVAHHPCYYENELVWANGEYYPLFNYKGTEEAMSSALRDASLALNDSMIYVAMADEGNGAESLGAYTKEDQAVHVLEAAINTDCEIKRVLSERGKQRFTLDEYMKLFGRLNQWSQYWIVRQRVNQAPKRK